MILKLQIKSCNGLEAGRDADIKWIYVAGTPDIFRFRSSWPQREPRVPIWVQNQPLASTRGGIEPPVVVALFPAVKGKYLARRMLSESISFQFYPFRLSLKANMFCTHSRGPTPTKQRHATALSYEKPSCAEGCEKL